MTESLLRPATCPKCGKIFYPTAEHVYRDRRRNEKAYCSWTCFNHRYDDAENHKPIEMLDFSGRVMRTFTSVSEALLYVDGTPKGLLNAVRNETGYKRFKWRYKKS